VDGEHDVDAPRDDCDLDCLEAREKKEDEKEQRKKGALKIGEETGSINKEVHDDPGDTLAAEPSTTSFAETKSPAISSRLRAPPTSSATASKWLRRRRGNRSFGILAGGTASGSRFSSCSDGLMMHGLERSGMRCMHD
jgi:hypothetical protein